MLDETHLGLATDNRWSALRVRAYYFASDLGLVVAEHARHIAVDVPGGRVDRIERSVFRVPIDLDRVLTLTDPAVVAAMGAAPINSWILDLGATQAAANHLLAQVPGLEAIVVPSVAFLDQHDRFNVVVYRDAIDLSSAFSAPAFELDIVLRAAGTATADGLDRLIDAR